MDDTNFGTVPARIQAAQTFVDRYLDITDPPACCASMGGGRSLTTGEQAAYDAAMTAMRLYFKGEMDFGDRPITTPTDDDSNTESPSGETDTDDQCATTPSPSD